MVVSRLNTARYLAAGLPWIIWDGLQEMSPNVINATVNVNVYNMNAKCRMITTL